MPALLQDAFRGVSPAVLSTWPGGVGALNVPIPLRGGGAPNMSVITPGLVAKRIAQFNKSRANVSTTSTTKNPKVLYPEYSGLMLNQEKLKAIAGGYRSRKQRRRPTRKAHRKSRRLTRHK
jgi:hypothetical protein